MMTNFHKIHGIHLRDFTEGLNFAIHLIKLTLYLNWMKKNWETTHYAIL